jgi:hypothetical protein
MTVPNSAPTETPKPNRAQRRAQRHALPARVPNAPTHTADKASLTPSVGCAREGPPRCGALPAGLEPLTVPTGVGRALIGVGNTKWWELVRAGKIELAEVGGRRMATYASLKRLAQPKCTAASTS